MVQRPAIKALKVLIILIKNKLFSYFFLIFSILLLFYISSIGIKNIFRYNSFNKDYLSLSSNLKKETSTNKLLNQNMKALNDIDFWEVSAKKRLGFIKKGEAVYKFIYK
ncbi:septum formation initiator family protein [Candidatus Margulisiibacteriota bacterium]